MRLLFPFRRLLLVAMTLLTAAPSVLAEGEPSDSAPGDDDIQGIYVRLDQLDSSHFRNAQAPVMSQQAPVIATGVDDRGDVGEFLHDDFADGSCACGDYWGWTILPVGIIYRSYLAGVNESRLGLQIAHVADNDDEPGMMFDGTLGGRKGLIRYGNRDPYCPQGFQVDVEAAAHVRLSFEEDMDVQATDYRVGVPFTYGWGNKQIKFGYWHVSSHLGDEFMIRNAGNFTRYNYAKDSLVFGYSEYVTDELRLYAEASWAFWSDVAEPWEFQFGLDHAPRCATGAWGAPFYAANVHLREEVNFGGNVVVQAGWAWRADEGAGLLRIGAHYFNGQSNQRSFWNQHEEQIGFGIWYDY